MMRRVAAIVPSLVLALAGLSPTSGVSPASGPDLTPTDVVIGEPASPISPLSTGIAYLPSSSGPAPVVNSPVHFESGVRNGGCLNVDITLDYKLSNDTLIYTFDNGVGKAVLKRE
jgi:hypothetical protein